MLRVNNFVATKQQVDIFNTVSNIHSLIEEMVDIANESLDSIVNLPHENEDSEKVTHGANQQMRYIAECYYSSIVSLVQFIPNKDDMGNNYFPLMYLRNRINGVKIEWINKMVEKNNGVPPRKWNNNDCYDYSLLDNI